MATATAAIGSTGERVKDLLREQRVLVVSLLTLRTQLRGSLFRRWVRCGKAGCACRRGRPHGPYYVLSTRSGGTGGFAYVDKKDVARTRERVEGYRRFRAGLRRLRRLNGELLRLMGRYQRVATRETAPRTGLS
jgi:hypothetical protein